MQLEQPLIVSSSPHIHSGYTISGAMRDVIYALSPAVIAAVYFFGLQAFAVILTCILAAVLAEFCCQKIMARPITLSDGSAALTGLLLAMCLPPALPLWIAALGSFFAIIIGKQVFGGLGCNVFNPAHIGRAILLASFPAQMTTWSKPQNSFAAFATDAVSGSTPLAELKNLSQQIPPQEVMTVILENINFLDLVSGNTSGSLGETSALLLLLGGLYLIFRGHIDWRIPTFYLGSVFVIMFVYGIFHGYGFEFPLFHLLSGGLMIGAFFMATDWVTSPLTYKGRIIFALGLGFLTCLIRLKSSYTEGVCYAILLMNTLTPLIDRYTKRRVFGRQEK